MATAHSPIFCLLRIIQLFSHCASPNYVYCKSTNYFTTGNRQNICLLCVQILYDTFTSPILKHFNDLYDYCAKHNFLAIAHHTIIFLLRISQLFVYCKSTNYFTTGNSINICLLCIEILCWKFKSPIWKQFYDSYGYCAKPNFLATAHHTIIFLLSINKLFAYCKSTYYFITGNCLNICLLWFEKFYDNFKSPIWKRFNDLYGYFAKPNFLVNSHLWFCYCASPNYLYTANRQIISPLEIVYTGCNRRKGPNFGRVFLMWNYTEKIQNTYIQSWTVWEIIASEVWNFGSCYWLPNSYWNWQEYVVSVMLISVLNIKVTCEW